MVFSFGQAAGAHANDLPDNCSYDPNNYHIIDFEGPWPSTAQVRAQDGFGWWSNVKDLDGNPAVYTTYGWHGDTEAIWEPWGGSGWGFGLCGSRLMEFYGNNIGVYASSSPDFFRSVTAHEYGHVLGLGHSGVNDSPVDGMVPVMATSRGTTWLSQDDRSAIQAVKSESKSDSVFWPTPNASFEDGVFMWQRRALSWQLNSYAPEGNKSLRIMANGSGSNYARSETRLLDNQGHDLSALLIAGFIRRPFSNTFGHVSFALQMGKVTYPHGESPGYPDVYGWDGAELNQNGATSLQWTAFYSADCAPGASWSICADSAWRPIPSAADGVQVRAYAYPHMYINGTSTPTWADIDQLSFLADFN